MEKMQSYDEQQNLINSIPLVNPLEERMKQIQAEIYRKEVANVVVGKLPDKGQSVKINGLVFEVKFVDYKRGTLQLKLAHYKDDTEDENGVTHERGEIVKG
jgi:hypothetical protein